MFFPLCACCLNPPFSLEISSSLVRDEETELGHLNDCFQNEDSVML